MLLVCLAHRAAALEWQQCSDQRTTVKSIKSATLTPEPVPAGSAASFTIEGSSSEKSRLKKPLLYSERIV